MKMKLVCYVKKGDWSGLNSQCISINQCIVLSIAEKKYKILTDLQSYPYIRHNFGRFVDNIYPQELKPCI